MNTSTLTIRLPKAQREVLREAAGALKKTESEYIREMLARDLDDITLADRVRDLAGSLHSGRKPLVKIHPLKDRMRANNWRT